jgi:dihydroflavonol-4-reductase
VTTLVTGATGFLGRHLVRELVEEGAAVRCLVRPTSDTAALLELGAELVTGDVLDEQAVRRAASGCARVFHLAGVVSHVRRDRARLTAVNVGAVGTVLRGAEPDARIVHVSSLSAIGPAPRPDAPADETNPFPPWAERFAYASTKRAGELQALAAARAGRDVVVANPGFVIGPGDVNGVSTWTIPAYLRGRIRFHVTGGLSYVDVRDVAAGLVALAERGRAGERTILTSAEGNLSHAAFFRRVGAVAGVRRLMAPMPARLAPLLARLPGVPVEPDEAEAASHWWFATPAKAERELGFVTRSLDEAIVATIEFARSGRPGRRRAGA